MLGGMIASILLAMFAIGFVVLGYFMLIRWWNLRRSGQDDRCGALSTPHGKGYDSRPVGLRCLRKLGHSRYHTARSPDGKLWAWDE